MVVGVDHAMIGHCYGDGDGAYWPGFLPGSPNELLRLAAVAYGSVLGCHSSHWLTPQAAHKVPSTAGRARTVGQCLGHRKAG